MPVLDGIELIEQIGERVGRGEIIRPEIYVLSGGHERSGKLYNLKAYGFVKKTFQKPMSPIQVAKELRDFYDSLKS